MTEPRRLPAGIREHPPGSGRFQVRFYDQDGKRRSQNFKRLSDAKVFKRDQDTDRGRGVLIDHRRGQMRFGEWADYYLETKLRIRRRTRDKYESSLRLYLAPEFGHKQLGQITREHLRAWVARLDREGLGAETIRGHYSLLAAMLGLAADDGYIAQSPCRRIELPARQHTEQRFLEEQEVERLVDAHPDRYRALIYVGAYLGLRWQEVAAIRREALDMRPGKLASLRVTRTIERSKGTYRVVDYGKTKAARRTLKMPDFLREVLAAHLSTTAGSEWMFPAPEGGFLRYDNYRRRTWTPAVEAAGLSPLKFHELRHTAAAFMVNDGADPLQVKRRMGHEDVRTTFNLYGHLFPDREDELVAALDRRQRAVSGLNGDKKGTEPRGRVLLLEPESASDLRK